MATGRSNYLTKQTGEYIVAAELSRRGFIATTFTGNVPSYDIVAVDDQGGHALVQVKAIAAASWQLNVGQFADVAFDGPKQIIQGQLDDPYPDLVCVMVQIAPPDSGRADRFFILPWRELGKIVIAGHSRFLAKHGGVRPRSPASLHTAVHPEALAHWEGRWQVLTRRVRPTPANTTLQPTTHARKARGKSREGARAGRG
ncbi:MAG: hypothetical protein HY268_14675 [Deltaproteobacteria bacterium]|nr:hypothetical protein [Deltaproteobacteria bacterium]